MAEKFDFGAYGTAHVPEDKDQRLVATPYGQAMVIRTRRADDGSIEMREMELTDWQSARPPKKSGPDRPTTLFSPLAYPSIAPSLGNDVLCLFGRGRVIQVNGDKVSVRLSSWRLAGRSRVVCHLQRAAVEVVRPKRLYEMSVYEKVEYAQELKTKAAKQFAHKLYQPALETYAKAVDAVRYVQHKTDSSNEVRADLVVLMVTCSNNAGTCCTQLSQWEEARQFGKNAAVLIDALEEKVGLKIHTLLNKEGISDAKLFGEWRVKSYLLMARAMSEKKDTDEALEILKTAHDVVVKYTSEPYADDPKCKASVKSLLTMAKEIKKLHVACKERRKSELKKERLRAQKMFAGNDEEKKEISEGSPSSSPTPMPTPVKDEAVESSVPLGGQLNGVSHSPMVDKLQDKDEVLDSPRRHEMAKKRVSFADSVSERLYLVESEEEEESQQVIGWHRDARVGTAAGLALGVLATLTTLRFAAMRPNR